MSSSDRENDKIDEEEINDLNDLNEEDEDDEVISRNGSRRNRTEDNNDDNDNEDEDGLQEEDDIFGDIDDEEDQNNDDSNNQQEEVEQVLRIEETTIPRYPRSHKPSDNLYYVPTPAFMGMEPHPFEASKFQDEISEQQNTSEEPKARNEYTVRWKYAKDSKGNVIKQSNTRIIKWSDGSMSLQLGPELFDIVIQEPYDQTFLCLSHPANGLLQTSGIFNKNMRIVPTSTASRSHKALAHELTAKQLSGSTTISSVATTDDPEKVQREAEKIAEMTLRARRKLESKQRLQLERTGGNPSLNSLSSRYYGGERGEEQGDNDQYNQSTAIGGRPGDDYEEDDFVVDDEEVEEDIEEGEEDIDEGADDLDDLEEDEDDDEIERQRAKRLDDLKQKGADLYSSRRSEERESQQQIRKKRRIFDDEDDDDE